MAQDTAAADVEIDLRSAIDSTLEGNLRSAIAAELTTLPTYLYPYWSIRPPEDGGSAGGLAARTNLIGVIVEEMLHMGLSSNLLNALGGTPAITTAPYLPTFPSGLLRTVQYPGGVPGAAPVDLLPMSEACIDMLLKIELPESLGFGTPTLGEFYTDSILHMLPADDAAYQGGRQLPAYDNPGPGVLFQIDSAAGARRAVSEVIDQGEGLNVDTHKDGDHELAHFFRFIDIKNSLTNGTFNAKTDIYPVIASPRAALASYNAAQLAANEAFNRTYSRMLDAIEQTLATDSPDVFGPATQLMSQLGQQAAFLRQQGEVATTGLLAGPTFDYIAAGE